MALLFPTFHLFALKYRLAGLFSSFPFTSSLCFFLFNEGLCASAVKIKYALVPFQINGFQICMVFIILLL